MQLNDIQGVCQDAEGTWKVTFSLDASEPSQYYAPARMVGEPYLNCTRNPMTHQRPLELPSTSSAEFTAAGKPSTARQPTSLKWTPPTLRRSISEPVQPGESSWIEFQESRAKGTGTFTITDEAGSKLVITGTFDCPDSTKPDRTYQRTGPLTATEIKRCQEERKNAASAPTSPAERD
ncbi:hypothetical protein [Streptomyces sp. HUAS TT7]|uniref:hypothetical protein n=1 Tax=Streptomyces sp. HUAS TT7 TaxID=3447507 RepID=UPI003F65783F